MIRKNIFAILLLLHVESVTNQEVLIFRYDYIDVHVQLIFKN